MHYFKSEWGSHRRINDKTVFFSLFLSFDLLGWLHQQGLFIHPSNVVVRLACNWGDLITVLLSNSLKYNNEKENSMEEKCHGYHCSSRKSSASTKEWKSTCFRIFSLFNPIKCGINRLIVGYSECLALNCIEWENQSQAHRASIENWFNKWCASDLWMGIFNMVVVDAKRCV